MNLKKNDKIILLVGVVILIIAGAGIALYNVDETDGSELGEDLEYDIYSYNWIKNTGDKAVYDGQFVNKNEPFEDTFTIQAPSNSVLTRVELTLNWEDDVTYGLLTKKGLDTLTLEVTLDGKTEGGPYDGSGNDSFSFNINNMPDSDSVKEKSQAAAEDIIDDQISGMNTETFDITASVETGERVWRLLKFIRDKGNDFELLAEYTYYTYELQLPEDSDDNDDDTKETGGDDGFNHNVGEFYVNLGYGRGWI